MKRLFYSLFLLFGFFLAGTSPLYAACGSYFTWKEDTTGMVISFQDLSTDNMTNWIWKFGDGTGSTEQNPVHTYGKQGVYKVCLTAYMANSTCKESVCLDVIVKDPASTCKSEFRFEIDSAGSQVRFINQSTAGKYGWNFGDGTMSTEKSPDHNYKPGIYKVCLVVEDTTGCRDVSCQPVSIQNYTFDCKAEFRVKRDSTGMGVFFSDTSIGKIDHWIWNFGDGTSSTERNPFHKYAKPGGYNVCLVVENTDGCRSETCHKVYVDTFKTGSCQSAFRFEIDTNGTHVFFINESVGDHFVWHFGDGMQSTENSPDHTYNSGGIYKVCLVTEDSTGCRDVFCREIGIKSQIRHCEANYKYKYTPDHLAVKFQNESIGGKFLWDFNDGTKSTEVSPVHKFSNSGKYNVCLIAATPLANCADTICREIIVGSTTTVCLAKYRYEIDSTGSHVKFLNESRGSKFAWNFGDGIISTEKSPVHYYKQPGIYKTCLRIEDSTGCFDVMCQAISIQGQTFDCKSEFLANHDSTGLGVFFKDVSKGLVDYWVWKFGDGNTSTEQNPHHVYNQPGNYHVCLVVESKDGCRSEVCHNIFVKGHFPPPCRAEFSYIVSGTTIYFRPEPHAPGQTISASWNFGDGSPVVHGLKAYHDYKPGVYNTCMFIETDLGCRDTICKRIVISDLCTSDCVWPGDANNDGVANIRDVLFIGRSFKKTGPARKNATTDWVGQAAPPWPSSFRSSLNHKHADSDGDGLIELKDVLAVRKNYGNVHKKWEESYTEGDVELYPEIIKDTIQVGSSLSVPIKLGRTDRKAEEIYGIAFSVSYNPRVVKFVQADFSKSWLGPQTNLINVHKDFGYAMDIGVSRINHTNITGFGDVAVLNFVMVDDIAGKKEGIAEIMKLELYNIELVDTAGNTIPVEAISDSVVVISQETGINGAGGDEVLNIYPNPVEDLLNIHYLLGNKNGIITVQSILGQVLLQKQFSASKTKIDVSDLTEGIYVITVQADNKLYTKKITITR